MNEWLQVLTPLVVLIGVTIGVMLASGPPYRNRDYRWDPEREQRRNRRQS